MKLFITGSPDIHDIDLLDATMATHGLSPQNVDQVVGMGGEGVEALAKQWAREQGIDFAMLHYNWMCLPLSMQVRKLLDYCDGVVVIWDEQAPFARYVIERARLGGLVVYAQVHHRPPGQPAPPPRMPMR